MNRDQIERALRQAGPREHGYVHVSLPTTAGEARPRRGLVFAARVATFATVVAGGAAVALLLTRGVGGLGPGTGAASAPPSGGTPSLSPILATCRAGDFAWTADPWGGFAGGRGTSVLAKVVSSVPACTISGRARLVLMDANGTELATVVAPATRTTLHADEAVEMGVTWSNWCGASPSLPVSLSVALPDSPPVTLTPDGSEVPGCSGGAATSLGATNFQPTNRKPQG
jgi:hypothetical protein